MCTEYVLFALSLCIDDTAPTMNGLRALYNFCFRDQGAHTILREYVSATDKTTVFTALDSVRGGSSFGEFEVRREYKRLQLALEIDGWRGSVEEQMLYPTTWEHSL